MMVRVKTKGPFKTRAHRVISRGPGELINMPQEDYEEVRDLCEVEESVKEKEKDHGTGKSTVSRDR